LILRIRRVFLFLRLSVLDRRVFDKAITGVEFIRLRRILNHIQCGQKLPSFRPNETASLISPSGSRE